MWDYSLLGEKKLRMIGAELSSIHLFVFHAYMILSSFNHHSFFLYCLCFCLDNQRYNNCVHRMPVLNNSNLGGCIYMILIRAYDFKQTSFGASLLPWLAGIPFVCLLNDSTRVVWISWGALYTLISCRMFLPEKQTKDLERRWNYMTTDYR